MVVRAANGLSNCRSTLITGMPASIALRATGVRAAPSKGSSTIASTLSLMKVSTWLICVLTSLVPSATCRSTSSYSSAAALAALVIPAIQPWSAAGGEKPMVTVSPLSSLELAALPPPPLEEELSSGELLVQPATRVVAPTRQTVVDNRRRNGRCGVADIVALLGGGSSSRPGRSRSRGGTGGGAGGALRGCRCCRRGGPRPAHRPRSRRRTPRRTAHQAPPVPTSGGCASASSRWPAAAAGARRRR